MMLNFRVTGCRYEALLLESYFSCKVLWCCEAGAGRGGWWLISVADDSLRCVAGEVVAG